jgi:hypothetical protein
MNGAQLTGLLEREGLLLAELEQWHLALGDEVSAWNVGERRRTGLTAVEVLVDGLATHSLR